MKLGNKEKNRNQKKGTKVLTWFNWLLIGLNGVPLSLSMPPLFLY
jgi:hypothetical protein